MIVSEVMTPKVISVTPDDTLSHAANLLRQYQFHHLPVVKATGKRSWGMETTKSPLLLEGLITSQDIDLAAALESANPNQPQHQPWQDRRVAEVMQRVPICVTPTTSIEAAAQILVDRGLNALPVVEYTSPEKNEQNGGQEIQTVLVGLLTRSDLLIAMARAMGAYEPGMQIVIQLPAGDVTPLAQLLLLTKELHIQVRSIIAGPMQGSVPRVANVRIGTINPAPLLVRLQKANIQYEFADSSMESDAHV
jgi:acetoin utilization protein AcuB